MLTIEDFKKLAQLFVTKQEFQELKEALATKAQFSEVMTRIDKVFGELKAMRQEWTMHIETHDRIDKRLYAIEGGEKYA